MRKTPINDEKANELFNEYWSNLKSQDDLALFNTVLELENFFGDMMLDGESCVSDFIKYQCQTESGEWINDYADHYLSLTDKNWRFFVGRTPPGSIGACYHNERKIVVRPQYKNDKSVILHEMIHAHEAVLNECYPFYHDIVILCLYKIGKACPRHRL